MIRELVRQNQQSAMSPRTIGNGRFQRRAVRSAPEPMGEHNARGFQKQGYEISTYCSFLDIPLLAETNPAIQRTESNYSVYQSIQEGTADPTTTKTALNPCFQLPDSFQHIAKSEWIPKVPLTELRGDSWTIQLMEQRRQTKATVTRLKELAEFLDKLIGEENWALTGSCALNLWYWKYKQEPFRPAQDIDIVVKESCFLKAVLKIAKAIGTSTDPPGIKTDHKTLKGTIKVDVICSGSRLGSLSGVEIIGGFQVVGIEELRGRKQSILDMDEWEAEEETTKKAQKDMEAIREIVDKREKDK